MKNKTTVKQNTEINEKAFATPRRNVLYIIAGFIVMLIGYALMAGGGSETTAEFNEKMFSFRRIVLAPIVILAGMVLEIVAIMHRGKNNKE